MIRYRRSTLVRTLKATMVALIVACGAILTAECAILGVLAVRRFFYLGP